MTNLKFKNNNFNVIDSDIFSFVSNNKNKIFDITNEDAKKFSNELNHKNWQEVAFDMYYDTNQWLYEIITDSNRSDFLFLLDIKKDDLVLDVGAGWGQISVPLSAYCNVVALEKYLEKIEIIKKIAKQEKCTNIQYVAANFSDDVFEPNQFDLIILNGVFEWISEFSIGENPLEIQRRTLDKIFELLKPRGTLYIGIENRFGLKYILGEADDHTGLEDFVYLDHNTQSLLYKIIKQKDLRVFTHSKKNYQTMLEDAGFHSIRFFGDLPDYKRIKTMIDLSNDYPTSFHKTNLEFIPEFNGYGGHFSILNEKIRHIYTALSSNEIKNLYPSYSIIARKN
ncbi:class I SAM-dependent methyltransferase [Nitrosopumilus sp. b2]|uniref:class I SAM-dependent methyltransferase n=1 Tax=Nitrosopumilus sp. b2 TaxID=2109908 RepID=UPI0015F603CD|nr:class I SAM-dependent methyltransferase [Nitrosopumilus sp. b2]KAF6245751.1 hypothetical protein C6989_01030 [Nitrosopumilus sp. b2]